MKSSINKETVAKKDPLKAKGKWADVKVASSNAPKQMKTVQSDGKEATFQKINTVVPKPSVKVAPGMYKGKIIQSKIGSIWKSSSASQPPAPKPQNHRDAKVPQSRSKSVSEMSGSKAQKPTLTRSAANSRPAGFYSARPPARTFTATLTTTSSRKAPVIPSTGRGTQSAKPKMPVPDKKVNKPSVSSSVSQYRVSMESTEERRAKLAEWMASKGKTMRRPAMTMAAPAKVKVAAKPKGEIIMQKTDEAQAKAESRCAPEATTSAAAHRAHTQEAEPTVQSQTPQILDTYLDLLESSHTEQKTNVSVADNGSGKMVEEGAEKKWEVLEGVWSEQMKNEEEEGGNQEVETDDDTEEYEDEGKLAETPPLMEDASVIKYSVRTTPYLQSVRKTLEGGACSSTSKRKSNIKDLKFLTPVRRSCRIQQKSTCLPSMLVDHDPCVSSLAELVNLDDDANAYIYRKNTALLDDLPDQPSL
uniref:Cytoskeleton-associated protein 2-like n=1 Tax=Gouania willdenowi TaxID=441366 RepID=A0A8C5EX91_GOUWI